MPCSEESGSAAKGMDEACIVAALGTPSLVAAVAGVAMTTRPSTDQRHVACSLAGALSFVQGLAHD